MTRYLRQGRGRRWTVEELEAVRPEWRFHRASLSQRFPQVVLDGYEGSAIPVAPGRAARLSHRLDING